MDTSFFDQLPLLSQIPPDTREIIVKVVIVLLVVLVLFVLRRLVAGILLAPFRRWTRATDNGIDDIVMESLEGALSWMIMAIGVFVAAALFNFETAAEEFMFRLGLTLIGVGLFKFSFELIARASSSPRILDRLVPGKMRRALIPLVRIGGRVLVIVIAIVGFAQIWALDLAGIVAGLGLGGLALSLAAKELLDDIVGFAAIIGDDVFSLNEYIVSEHGQGIVESIGLRSTHIRQLDQGLVIAPNGLLANSSVTNWSRLEKRWFNFMVGITYATPAQKIEQFIQRTREMLKGRENVMPDSVLVLFTEYEEDGLSILIRFYVSLPDWNDAHAERHAVNLELMRIMHDLEIDVAFPARTLYLEKVPPSILDSISESGNGSSEHANGQRRERAPQQASGHYRKGGSDETPEGVDDTGGGEED